MMENILARIAEYKSGEIAAAKQAVSWNDVVARAHDAKPTRPFQAALRQGAKKNQFALIAEIKKASPSKGLIRAEFEPKQLAQAYQAGGATCLSVLTDKPSFQGSPDYFIAARAACSLPVLRKDFMLETYQVVEARSWGADCILIILAMVGNDVARFLLDAAQEWKMDALVEVHDKAEMERALALDAEMIGINNRNLRNFTTSLDTTIDLARDLPENVLLVSESGIAGHDSLVHLKKNANVSSFLVGESLMRQNDIEAATRSLLLGQ